LIAEITTKTTTIKVDLSNPLDLSISLRASNKNPEAWYVNPPLIEPVQLDQWVGRVSEGASVNFNNITFNPHAHGTHTECVGHISKEFYSVNKTLLSFFFIAEVISITPEKREKDQVISRKQLESHLHNKEVEAIVIRTLPNNPKKKEKKYSHTNWPYLTENAALYLRELGINHLLIDLPSIDREKDEGKLMAHKAFWGYPKNPRSYATITEFVYVSNTVIDGSYLLNLQMAPIENDASPSRPVLYKIIN